MQININNPSTVYISFVGNPPRYFSLKDDKGRIYYFRYMDGRTGRIKFNIPDKGVYTGDRDFQVLKITDIVLHSYPELPQPERNRWKEPTFVYNPNLTGTPCRINTTTGVIELSPEYYSFPPPIRLFLNLHEQGHFLYRTEEYCDLFALVNFLRMGYNYSTAYYTLDKILSRTSANLDRLKYLLTQIKVNGDNFTPY